MAHTPGSTTSAPTRLLAVTSVVALLGVLLSVAVFLWQRRELRRTAEARFEYLAHDRAQALDMAIGRSLATFGSIKGLYHASARVDRAEFAAFVTALQQDSDPFQAIEWLPRVGADERHSYEAAAHRDGLAGFRICQRDGTGAMVPAEPRSEYFPVYYVVPLAGNERAVGFDLASNPERLAALVRARDSGEMVASGAIALVQGTRSDKGFVVFDPVYRWGEPVGTVAQRRAALQGFVLAVFRISDLLEEALQTTLPAGLHFVLRDLDAPEESSVLSVHCSRTVAEQRGCADLVAELGAAGGLQHSAMLHTPGRRWAVTFLPAPKFWARNSPRDPYIALLAGLLLTVGGSLFVYWSGRSRAGLAQKELALRTAQAVAKTGSWVLDVDTGAVLCSDETYRLLGLPHGVPLTSEDLLSRIHGDDREGVGVAWRRALRDRVPFECVHRVPGDEAARWVASRADLQFDADGRARSAVGTVHDISELKEAEIAISRYSSDLETEVRRQTADLVEAREAAELANAAKSKFLASMSYEIRTSIGAILHTARLAAGDCRDDQERDRLGSIEESGNRLLEILNNLLDLSEIEAGKLRIQEVRFQIPALLERVRAAAEGQAVAKGLVVRQEVASGVVDRAFLGDPLRIAQILAEYCGNAVRSTEHGGITLRVRLAEDAPDHAVLHFEVQDTGAGIPDEQLGGVFDPSIGDGSSAPSGSTGFGLVLCRRLARLMGGDAGARHAVLAGGSVFWFSARVRPVLDEPTVERGGTGIRRGARVLVAEDDDIGQELARDLLGDLGLAVHVVGNGAEALAAVGEDDYAAILMDLMMPAMDGLDATRRIREAGHRLPIIAMTANTFDDDRKRCADAGMDDFVAKPIDFEALRAVLARWIPG